MPLSTLPRSTTAAHTRPMTPEEQAFAAATQCTRAHRTLRLIEGQEEACLPFMRSNKEPVSAYEKKCAMGEAALLARKDQATDSIQNCAPKSLDGAEEEFFSATAIAAAAGNIEAQLCYVAGRFNLQREWSNKEISEFSNAAPNYIDAALDRGDWRMVELLRGASPNVVRQYGLLEHVLDGSTDIRYRMNRLLRQGSVDPTYSYLLDVTIPQIQGTPVSIARAREAADAWVAETYDGIFSKTAGLSSAPVVCHAEEAR